jgi:UDP-N-acetyl-2-amino-2-deoxyglucuronate dehydrogenase
MTAPIRVAIVGSGVISHNHARAIERLPRLSIVAVVDPDPLASQRLADSLATPPDRYATLTDALATAAPDLVVVCTPSGTHAALAEEALAAGKHAVIEKPADAALPAARRLAALAEAAADRGQVCTVISQHRFDPASVAVHQTIVDGGFGRITSAVASIAWWRGQEYYDSAGWRGTWALDGGGAAMNQGVHTVDLLLWFLGRPVEVSAHTARLAHDRIEVEDVAVATVRFASGALAVLHATTAAYPGLSVRLQVHGDRGSAIIHDDQLEYLHSDVHSGPPPLEPGEWRGVAKPADAFVIGHWRQYLDVIDAIDHGRPASVAVADAVAAMAVVRAVYLSASLGRAIAFDEVLAGDFDDVPDEVLLPAESAELQDS